MAEAVRRCSDINTRRLTVDAVADDSTGYFVQPTIIISKDPKSVTFVEEIFGPVLSVRIYAYFINISLTIPQVYVYDDKDYEATLELIDSTTSYGLTGAM